MIMKRPIFGYSTAAMPKKAKEGDLFVDLTSNKTYKFEHGEWADLDAHVAVPTNNIEAPASAPIATPEAPKKTTRKRTTKSAK